MICDMRCEEWQVDINGGKLARVDPARQTSTLASTLAGRQAHWQTSTLVGKHKHTIRQAYWQTSTSTLGRRITFRQHLRISIK